MPRSDHTLDAAWARELDALDRALAGATADELGPDHGGLATLVEAIGDDRATLRPAFAAELGTRVAAGFPGRRRAPRLETRHWLTGLGAVATLAVVVAVMAGRGGGPAAPDVGTAGGPLSPVTGASTKQSVPAPSADSIAAGPALAPAPRTVQRDASLDLLAPRGRVQQVTDRAIAATDRLGGIVESSNVAVDDQGGSQATLALRVPTAVLDRALSALSALAHVSSRSQSALDITDATGGARERLAEARAERTALLGQLARAITPNAVASLRARLNLVAGRVKQDEARLATLVGHGRYAQLQVTIDEDQHAAAGGWSPGAAVDDALGVLEAVFAVVVVALAGLVPAAALAALAWWATRLLRRRRRAHALAAAG